MSSSAGRLSALPIQCGTRVSKSAAPWGSSGSPGRRARTAPRRPGRRTSGSPHGTGGPGWTHDPPVVDRLVDLHSSGPKSQRDGQYVRCGALHDGHHADLHASLRILRVGGDSACGGEGLMVRHDGATRDGARDQGFRSHRAEKQSRRDLMDERLRGAGAARRAAPSAWTSGVPS